MTVIGTDGYAAVDGFTIQNGAARFGGGLNVLGSPVIAHNLIRFNVAVSGASTLLAAGGGLYAAAGSPTVANNVFVGNRAPTNSTLYGRGGALYFDAPGGHLPRVVHNTLLTNTAASGGGLFLATGTSARIANNIVAFGSSGLAAASPGTVATYNCVFGNTTNDYAGITAGSGSLSADPRLVAWRSGNYRLRADSPASRWATPPLMPAPSISTPNPAVSRNVRTSARMSSPARHRRTSNSCSARQLPTRCSSPPQPCSSRLHP
ncbi:MAG: hypothetical protein M5U12_03415 [Verrucomicrobia bacterium]|nr:hypothetical protein [Verrucomicrobiota bacterium]